MTKKEKLMTLQALKNESLKKIEKANSENIKSYEKGRLDALDYAISILKNDDFGNALKRIYLGKEKS